jgi:hypothetical protein
MVNERLDANVSPVIASHQHQAEQQQQHQRQKLTATCMERVEVSPATDVRNPGRGAGRQQVAAIMLPRTAMATRADLAPPPAVVRPAA